MAGDETFILEGIVTTLSADGVLNVAPMGPTLALLSDGTPDWSRLTLRPFSSSRTYANLAATPSGVFHVVDDVLLLAKAAIGVVEATTTSSEFVPVPRLIDCCRWYEFEVTRRMGELPRETLHAEVRHAGTVRPFVGFHRARHAVLEAAILATRVGILDAAEISAELDRLRPLVEKTATRREREAWSLLEAHCRQDGVN